MAAVPCALYAQAAQTATTSCQADRAEIAQSAPAAWSLTDAATGYKTGRLQYSAVYYASNCVPGPCFEPLPEDAINKVGLGLAPKQVQAGAILIVTRTGEYTGSLLLELEARGFDGVYKRTAPAAPTDLRTLPIGQLVDLPLAPGAADRLVLPNECLAVRVHRSGAQAGDLTVWPAVYATVRDAQNESEATPPYVNHQLPLPRRAPARASPAPAAPPPLRLPPSPRNLTGNCKKTVRNRRLSVAFL